MAVHEQWFGSHSQDWVLSSALGIVDYRSEITTLCFKEPIKLTNRETQIQSHNSPLFMDFSIVLASELEKQRVEMDWFLNFQNERLMTILQEEARRQNVLLQKYESKLTNLMIQRDDDLTSATSRTMELQNYLARAEMEAQAWQKKAMENEAMVLDLHKKLSQMRERVKDDHYCLQSVNGAQDAESVCDIEEENQYDSGSSSSSGHKKLACKLCHVRSSCVLFLPCRHLCCCKSCEGLLGFCLVCGAPKNAGLEIFLGLEKCTNQL